MKLIVCLSAFSDPTYFPFRKAGEERVVSLSGASYMPGNENLDREMSIAPEVGEWAIITEMRYHVQTIEDQQELGDLHNVSEKDVSVDMSTPI